MSFFPVKNSWQWEKKFSCFYYATVELYVFEKSIHIHILRAFIMRVEIILPMQKWNSITVIHESRCIVHLAPIFSICIHCGISFFVRNYGYNKVVILSLGQFTGKIFHFESTPIRHPSYTPTSLPQVTQHQLCFRSKPQSILTKVSANNLNGGYSIS